MTVRLLAGCLLVCLAVAAASAQTPAPAAADARRLASEVLHRLDAAWNAADGKAFAAEFTDDTDVINLFGGVYRGRPALAERMQAIFGTIFKGSVLRSRELEQARMLAPGVMLAVSSSRTEVPAGQLAPEVRSRQTFILVQERGAWRIRHWHNTRIQQP